MRINKVFVPYGDDEDKKKLEDYIEEKTGERISLGPIGYGGELTIQMLDVFFNKINRINITCAALVSGKHFRSVDEFIKWHKRLDKMGYFEALKKCSDYKDVVALFYNEELDNISYAYFRMGDKNSIENLLGPCSKEALPIKVSDRVTYWLLLGETNNNLLLFGKVNDNIDYSDISTNEDDIDFFKYLISIN